MVGGVEQQVVDVDDDVLEAADDGLHQPLEAGRRTEEPHGGRDPLELAHAGHGEGRVRPRPGLQQKLPEASCQVDGREDRASGPSDFPNALADILHGVLVQVRLGVEGPEVLDQADAPVLLGHGEDGAVVLAACALHHAHLEPLGHVTFDLLPVCVWDLELLHVDRLVGLERDLVEQGLGLPEVEFVPTDALVILQYDLEVPVLEVVWDVQLDVLQDEVLLLRAQPLVAGLPVLRSDRVEVLRVDLVQFAVRNVLHHPQGGVPLQRGLDRRAVVHWDGHEALAVGLHQVRPAGDQRVVGHGHVHEAQVATTRGTAPISSHSYLEWVHTQGVQLGEAVHVQVALGPFGRVGPPEPSVAGGIVQLVGLDEVDAEYHGFVEVRDDERLVHNFSALELHSHSALTLDS